jgi:hypothetical protein
MDKPQRAIKFRHNLQLKNMIAYCRATEMRSESDYVERLLNLALTELYKRLEHENPNNVIEHMQDAVNFFRFDESKMKSIKINKEYVLHVKKIAKYLKQDLKEFTTMLICYSILRD